MSRGAAFLVGALAVWALLALDVIPPPKGATEPCGCGDSEADPWPEGWPDPVPA